MFLTRLCLLSLYVTFVNSQFPSSDANLVVPDQNQTVSVDEKCYSGRMGAHANGVKEDIIKNFGSKDAFDLFVANTLVGEWTFNVPYFIVQNEVPETIPSRIFEIGPYGELTESVSAVHAQIQEFWANTNDMENFDIPLIGAHGDFMDTEYARDYLLQVFQSVYMLPIEDATSLVDYLYDGVYSNFTGGWDNPYLSFNARQQPDRENKFGSAIVWGDGLMRYFNGTDLDINVVTAAITGHEHGHFIQSVLDMALQSVEDPATTRYFEMMADSFGGYILGHSRGLALDDAALCIAYETIAETGDCI